jgi:hypothetical protein
MKINILRVSVLQSAKVMAVLYFAMSIPFALLFAIPMLLSKNVGGSLFALVLMPLMYLVVGFLLSLLGAWLYNLVAAGIGGYDFVAETATGQGEQP